MFTIEITSSYEEYWRYNTILMCGGYSSNDEQLYVATERDTIAEVGDEIRVKPQGYTSPRTTQLTCEECDHIRAMVYVVPHTLPKGSKTLVEDHPAFTASITIRRDDELIYENQQPINQWSGISLEIKL